MSRIGMFGQNIYLLIGLLIAAAVVILLIIVVWTAVNTAVWRWQKKAAEERQRCRNYFADGTPRPPTGRGICTGCSRASEVVYHLPTGERLCQVCFEAGHGGRCAAVLDERGTGPRNGES